MVGPTNGWRRLFVKSLRDPHGVGAVYTLASDGVPNAFAAPLPITVIMGRVKEGGAEF